VIPSQGWLAVPFPQHGVAAPLPVAYEASWREGDAAIWQQQGEATYNADIEGNNQVVITTGIGISGHDTVIATLRMTHAYGGLLLDMMSLPKLIHCISAGAQVTYLGPGAVKVLLLDLPPAETPVWTSEL
jgi:hypothetical protein